MRKIKEVLRLKHGHGLSERQIALSCGVSRSAVAEYLRRAQAAGLGWPLPGEMDDAAIEALLFQDKPEPSEQQKPDFAAMHQELQSRKDVTLQLLWTEYKETYPHGYQYSQFCELYRKWAKKLDLVLRQPHRAGEKLFVDYAGQKVGVTDRLTGEVRQASVFVAVLGASNYTYAEASLSENLPAWIGAHVRALEFIGGCPEIVVPDNLKTGVKLPSRYEPDINPTYQEMAEHYGLAVIPARVARPRDKAKAENGVLVVERWILAALRRRTFFNLGELNQAIGELLLKLNSRPFRKMRGSRRELFEQIDHPALKPLPAERYEFAEWKWTRVSNDYHVQLGEHHYSVPSNLVGLKLEMRYTAETVEVFHKGVRVAAHALSNERRGATTIEGHRPESHRRYLGWDYARLMSWVENATPSIAALAREMLKSGAHREQLLRSCLGLMRLGERYGEERLEAACARALKFNTCSYKSVESILKTGLDRIAESRSPQAAIPVVHDNIRGADYFEMLEEGRHVN
ncbi:MAG: IS21 family transposase [Acidobacteriota bacterium]